jgi:predicted phage terminase large subunit-like protein
MKRTREGSEKPVATTVAPKPASGVEALTAYGDQIEREYCQRAFRNFVERAWPIVEPKAVINRAAWWYIDAVCEHLQALALSEIQNLLINMPGRHGKSLLSMVFLPAWVWTWAAHKRFIFASYAAYLSRRDSRKTRTLILSNWYQRLWGHQFTLLHDQNQVDRFDNTATGFRVATSVGGLGTGEGGHLVGVDDPHNVQQAESDTKREGAIEWWDETMGDRLDDPKTGGRLVVAHRVHARDLSQHVLEQGGYTHLSLPLEYEPDRACYTKVKPRDVPESTDGRYKWDPRTKAGELIDPDRMGEKEVKELKKRLGSYAWPARLQQRPSLREGGMIKLAWFGRFDTPPAPPSETDKEPGLWQLVQSWDTANKGGQQSAYSVCHTFIRTSTHSYWVHTLRERMSQPELQRTVIDHAQTDWGRPHAILIENAASGIGLIQHLQQDTDLPIIPRQPVLDKVTRMDAETPAIEAGYVVLPEHADWLPDLEGELRDFPSSAFKDQVDALSQYLAWVRQGGSPDSWELI